MVKLNSKYLKPSTVKSGDTLKIIDEGAWQESKYKYDDGTAKNDFVITVETNGEQASFRCNKTNRDTLVQAWGSETCDWLGNTAVIAVENILVGGEKRETIMLTPEAWDDSR